MRKPRKGIVERFLRHLILSRDFHTSLMLYTLGSCKSQMCLQAKVFRFTWTGYGNKSASVPLHILWAIIGGCAHTSKWQGSSRLDINNLSGCIPLRSAGTWASYVQAHCSVSAPHQHTPRGSKNRCQRGGFGEIGLFLSPVAQIWLGHRLRAASRSRRQSAGRRADTAGNFCSG